MTTSFPPTWSKMVTSRALQKSSPLTPMCSTSAKMSHLPHFPVCARMCRWARPSSISIGLMDIRSAMWSVIIWHVFHLFGPTFSHSHLLINYPQTHLILSIYRPLRPPPWWHLLQPAGHQGPFEGRLHDVHVWAQVPQRTAALGDNWCDVREHQVRDRLGHWAYGVRVSFNYAQHVRLSHGTCTC